ncbi:MAG: tRNA uridine-5-carboxymethylaminomethyl(34) synthesis GTPase MnmE [Prevotella sp.]|nr:tRNA uridine-5-carboxymethylaminomethyl(34) synthesis GTPase MnmE [Prevotella sp.]
MTNDTICALATPAGGAIGMIRISGDKALELTDRVFRPAAQGRRMTEAHAGTVHYGTIVDGNGAVVDEVLVTVFRAPHSYTGEDSTEISCHGSRYILNKVLQLLISVGCRQAEPGEYTRRAYLNGKMDLSQAEAVADLIASTNSATHRLALGQLRGNVSTELSHLRDRLLRMTSLMELELDFSDHEELEFADRAELLRLAQDIDSRITALASSFSSGKAIKQGIPVAIVGKTNVGKSTLLNLLVGEEKAIVSDIHGTTRDVIEDIIDINGVTFRLMDTAGLRSTDDKIESIGIERTYKKLNDATIILWLLDSIPAEHECDEMLALSRGKKLIVVNNKTDVTDFTDCLCQQLGAKAPVVKAASPAAKTIDAETINPVAKTIDSDVAVIGISARHATNIEELRSTIFRLSDIPAIRENDIIITSTRHYDSLLRAHDSITRVLDGLAAGLSGDLLSEDLRACLDSLGEITGGQITTSEVLETIFKHFCVGK